MNGEFLWQVMLQEFECLLLPVGNVFASPFQYFTVNGYRLKRIWLTVLFTLEYTQTALTRPSL